MRFHGEMTREGRLLKSKDAQFQLPTWLFNTARVATELLCIVCASGIYIGSSSAEAFAIGAGRVCL